MGMTPLLFQRAVIIIISVSTHGIVKMLALHLFILQDYFTLLFFIPKEKILQKPYDDCEKLIIHYPVHQITACQKLCISMTPIAMVWNCIGTGQKKCGQGIPTVRWKCFQGLLTWRVSLNCKHNFLAFYKDGSLIRPANKIVFVCLCLKTITNGLSKVSCGGAES